MAKRNARWSVRRKRPRGTTEEPRIIYVESSALLAALLEHDTHALRSFQGGSRLATSALTFAEAGRAIIRAQRDSRLGADDERAAVYALGVFERRCHVVAVTDAILARVRRPFPVEPVRTLDAVHLATAEELGEPPQLVTIVTRDARVKENARALGYRIE